MGATRRGAAVLKLAVFGAGYVGLSFAACMAEAGHAVLCADTDAPRIAGLRAGRMPLHEPGLGALVAQQTAAGRLRFTDDAGEAARHGDILFIVVNAPADAEGVVDLEAVFEVARAVGHHRDRDGLLVCKSTLPVGTADRVEAVVRDVLARRGATHRIAVAVNPEFLREGAAVRDSRAPDRIVVGSSDAETIALLAELYRPFMRDPARQWLVMDRRSAELAKYAANAMLATRISFMNEMARVAEQAGADIESVRRAIGADARIGPAFLQAGAGYGGSCLAKDLRALQHGGEGAALRLLPAVAAVNEAQKSRLFELVAGHFGATLAGRTLAVWGLAFKPDTDDMRDAPSLVLIERLLAAGARLRLHDPAAMPNARALLGEREGIAWCDAPEAALEGADVLVLVTEWAAYRRPDFARVAARLSARAVFDGRNLYDPAEVEAAGIACYGIGRGRSVRRG